MEISAAQPSPGDGRPSFDVGDLVVHPHHGAGRVVSRRRRRLLGGERSYLEINLVDCSLKIMMPCESAAAAGLRAVVGPRRLSRIVAVLEAEPDAVLGNWSARERHYRERLKRGDVLELASVVRDLAVRATESGLSAREDDLYRRLRRLLASELACALGVDPEGAVEYIEECVASRRWAKGASARSSS
jgi:CarD family transcriptional regulator, regulator of rRNA transcription